MADPRFYRNQGPFRLDRLCAAAGIALPAGADGAALVADLASREGAGPLHLSFFAGGRELKDAFAASHAGFCLVPEGAGVAAPAGTVLLGASSVSQAFAAIAALFYPEASLPRWNQIEAVDSSARLARDVRLAPGVVIGPGAEIGKGTVIGPNAVIGPGVAIGCECEIGANVAIAYAYLGDRVIVFPGAAIGQPGFGFASSTAGHAKIPQLGRVIIQDGVEIGAGSTIDRGALGDTVVGEGSKLDNLVQVGHNARIGRHCILVAQSGVGGSSVVEDFAILGGQVGLADHVNIGAGARLAARTAAVSGQAVEGGQDYGGVPAKPIREWLREIHAVRQLARRRNQDDDD